MLKLNSFVLMVAATLIMAANCEAQCNSCATSGQFSYPAASAGCGCGGGAAGFGQRGNHPRVEALKELNGRVTARNDAWPKPFNCADRQLYFATWEPMINQGFEEQCVLSSVHFDPESHELNRFGLHTVAGIMQNMPSQHKKVFVTRDADQSISDLRKKSVDEVVRTFYSKVAPNALVTFSNKLPSSIRGTKAADINRLFSDGAPNPIIPISSGNDSVTQSIQ